MLVLLSSIVFSALASEFAIAQMELTFMTYNIEGMRPGSDPLARLSSIIQNIERINPDVIGLQEINETKGGGGADNQAKAIAEALTAYFGIPYSWRATPTHDAWGGQFIESIAIITKHRVLKAGEQSLEAAEFPRKVLWNLIETPAGRVHFFTTHLSTSGDAVRARQGQQVMTYVADRENAETAGAAIVTGDFNDTPESPVVQSFLNGPGSSGYYDTFAQANPGAAGFTVDATAPSARIDYIFCKNEGGVRIESSDVECDTPYAPGKYPSDHYAVVTTISMYRLEAPRSIVFRPTLLGLRDTLSLTLTNRTDQPVSVLSASVRTSTIILPDLSSLPAMLGSRGSQATLRVVCSPEQPGEFWDTVSVTSDDPTWTLIKIPVMGRGVADIVPARRGRCYAISEGAGSDILRGLDLVNGTSVVIGPLYTSGLTGLAVLPSRGELYGVAGDSLRSRLLRISADSGVAVSAMTLPLPSVRTITFGRGDTLYAGSSSGKLYCVDIHAGTYKEIGSLTGMGFGGICYDQRTNLLWATSYLPPFTNDSLFTIDPNSGTVTLVGSSGLLMVTSCLAFDTAGVLYGLTGTELNLVVRIDKTTGLAEPVTYDVLKGHKAMAIQTQGTTSAGVADVPIIPNQYELFQNYPNPFNPTTEIRYSVPPMAGRDLVSTIGRDGQGPPARQRSGGGDSNVRLVVYDLLGREVAVLVNEKRAPGSYTVQFNAGGLASGVYFYRLTAGDYLQTKRLLLLR